MGWILKIVLFSIPRNKELMRIFKDLDLVEQLGSGIPRILKVYPQDCFQFSDNFLRIVLPASESSVLKDTEQVLTLITVMGNEKYSRLELMEFVGLKHRPTFLYNYLQPAIETGLIAMTIPDKPTSGNQKYYLNKHYRYVNSFDVICFLRMLIKLLNIFKSTNLYKNVKIDTFQ